MLEPLNSRIWSSIFILPSIGLVEELPSIIYSNLEDEVYNKICIEIHSIEDSKIYEN